MDKLQWFKFTPTDWIMGKIQRCPEITQARFMRLICLYWNKECLLTYEDAEIEIDKEHLDLLISKKIIKLVDEFISIEFLNDQLVSISETSQKRRESVLLRWAKVKQKDTSVLQDDTNVLQSDTDKSREDKSILTPAKADDVFDFNKYLETLNQKFSRSFKVVNEKTKKQIKARLKEKYTKQDIIDAINNCVVSEFHKGNGYQYCTPEFFSRADILDRWSDITKLKQSKVNIEL